MIINKILYKLFSLGDPKWGKSSINGEKNGTGKSNGDDDVDKRDRPSPGGRGENDPPDLEDHNGSHIHVSQTLNVVW